MEVDSIQDNELLGNRFDFRDANCLRRVMCSDMGSVTEASGSAKFSMGKSCAWASVHGPAQPKYARLEQLERASLEVDFSVMGDPSRDEKVDKDTKALIQRVLESAVSLETFPRMLIEVRVRVLRDDGACLATALNACVLALLDAAIPMNHTPIAISSCITKEGTLLDPLAAEEAIASSSFLNVFTADGASILASRCVGSYSMDQWLSVVQEQQEAVGLVEAEMRSAVGGKLVRVLHNIA